MSRVGLTLKHPVLNGGQLLEKIGGWTERFNDHYLAGFGVILTSILFMLSEPQTFHWFIIPAMVCGVLVGGDLVRWLRGSLDPFDPKGLVGLILFFGYFLAPLLHVYWNTYGRGFHFTGDFRTWLGLAGSLNALGVLCYKLTQRWSYQRTGRVRSLWKLLRGRSLLFLFPALIIGVSAHAFFYLKWSAAIGTADPQEMLKGSGWLLMLGEALPTLLFFWIISRTPAPKLNRSWLTVAGSLAFLAGVDFLWLGLRGSRSAFVVAMLIAVMLVHFYWRRLRAVHLLLALALFLPFMYFYGFYKGLGLKAVEALQSVDSLFFLEKKTRRNFQYMLLGDLARADVQARIANEIIEKDYRLRYGLTYLASFSMLIPSAFWEELMEDASFRDRWSKGYAFIELNESEAKASREYPKSSRIYGLTGEAMLNFGVIGVPLAWVLYGLAMGYFRKKLQTMAPGDSRWSFTPLIIAAMAAVPILDLDIIIFMLVKGGFLLFAFAYFCSRQEKMGQGAFARI
jgi:hypothetical protein